MRQALRTARRGPRLRPTLPCLKRAHVDARYDPSFTITGEERSAAASIAPAGFAKDDKRAEDIVEILRDEFAQGNEFCQKITYKTTGTKPADLIRDFRSRFMPRVAVTVDMIATGTDMGTGPAFAS